MSIQGVNANNGVYRASQVAFQQPLPLFNGTDLTGWTGGGQNFATWQEPGEAQKWLVATNTQDQETVLRTAANYKNFLLNTDVWIDEGTDGGIYIRGGQNEKGEAVGHQVRLDFTDTNRCIGGVYGHGCGDFLGDLRGMPKDQNGYDLFKTGQWNKLGIKVTGEGPRIEVWLNDVKINDVIPGLPHQQRNMPGYIGLQVHGGGVWQTGKYQKFRNMTIQQLPE